MTNRQVWGGCLIAAAVIAALVIGSWGFNNFQTFEAATTSFPLFYVAFIFVGLIGLVGVWCIVSGLRSNEHPSSH